MLRLVVILLLLYPGSVLVKVPLEAYEEKGFPRNTLCFDEWKCPMSSGK